jgi:hypothetical protein
MPQDGKLFCRAGQKLPAADDTAIPLPATVGMQDD